MDQNLFILFPTLSLLVNWHLIWSLNLHAIESYNNKVLNEVSQGSHLDLCLRSVSSPKSSSAITSSEVDLFPYLWVRKVTIYSLITSTQPCSLAEYISAATIMISDCSHNELIVMCESVAKWKARMWRTSQSTSSVSHQSDIDTKTL